jgi:hypothetical protein
VKVSNIIKYDHKIITEPTFVIGSPISLEEFEFSYNDRGNNVLKGDPRDDGLRVDHVTPIYVQLMNKLGENQTFEMWALMQEVKTCIQLGIQDCLDCVLKGKIYNTKNKICYHKPHPYVDLVGATSFRECPEARECDPVTILEGGDTMFTYSVDKKSVCLFKVTNGISSGNKAVFDLSLFEYKNGVVFYGLDKNGKEKSQNWQGPQRFYKGDTYWYLVANPSTDKQSFKFKAVFPK